MYSFTFNLPTFTWFYMIVLETSHAFPIVYVTPYIRIATRVENLSFNFYQNLFSYIYPVYPPWTWGVRSNPVYSSLSICRVILTGIKTFCVSCWSRSVMSMLKSLTHGEKFIRPLYNIRRNLGQDNWLSSFTTGSTGAYDSHNYSWMGSYANLLLDRHWAVKM